MDSIAELRARMESDRPCTWDGLPDLALYMDQIISYLPRQRICAEGEEEFLTPAMVNNYIKAGLLPRADGKRYARPHLAYLTAICVLKQVLSVHEMRVLLGEAHGKPTDELYAFFCEELDASLTRTAGELALPDDAARGDLARLALELALRSYANKVACQKILTVLEQSAPKQPTGGKKHE